MRCCTPDLTIAPLELLLSNIEDIDDEEHFKSVKQRLKIAKQQVAEAIQQFELGKFPTREIIEKTVTVDHLKKKIIDILISDNYDEQQIDEIKSSAQNLDDSEINSLLADLMYNWGTDLGKLAETKSGEDAERFYIQAFDKFRQAIALGGSCYNLACLYAVRSDKDTALKYLNKSLENKEIETEFIVNDEDWKEYLQDHDFLELIKRYS